MRKPRWQSGPVSGRVKTEGAEGGIFLPAEKLRLQFDLASDVVNSPQQVLVFAALVSLETYLKAGGVDRTKLLDGVERFELGRPLSARRSRSRGRVASAELKAALET